MADRLTTIESEIKTLLLTVVIPTSASPTAYNYYTSTGTVNIEDEVLSLATNSDENKVNYCIYLNEPEVNNEWSLCNSAYTNTVTFRIVARVHNVGDEGNPKFTINTKMNEVLSDLKYLFGKYYTLNGKCNYARYLRSDRKYHESNNRIMTADVEIYLTVNYSQSINNPNIGASF